MATILVGVLLLVSAVIAVFVLYRFRKSQELQVWHEYRFYFLESIIRFVYKNTMQCHLSSGNLDFSKTNTGTDECEWSRHFKANTDQRLG